MGFRLEQQCAHYLGAACAGDRDTSNLDVWQLDDPRRRGVACEPPGDETHPGRGCSWFATAGYRTPNQLSGRAMQFRFSWRDQVSEERKRVGYLVTDADWVALVEKFGLAPYLEDHQE